MSLLSQALRVIPFSPLLQSEFRVAQENRLGRAKGAEAVALLYRRNFVGWVGGDKLPSGGQLLAIDIWQPKTCWLFIDAYGLPQLFLRPDLAAPNGVGVYHENPLPILRVGPQSAGVSFNQPSRAPAWVYREFQLRSLRQLVRCAGIAQYNKELVHTPYAYEIEEPELRLFVGHAEKLTLRAPLGLGEYRLKILWERGDFINRQLCDGYLLEEQYVDLPYSFAKNGYDLIAWRDKTIFTKEEIL